MSICLVLAAVEVNKFLYDIHYFLIQSLIECVNDYFYGHKDGILLQDNVQHYQSSLDFVYTKHI